MAASYRNLINVQKISDAIASGDFSNLKKNTSNSAKYIKGYAKKSAIESLASSLNIDSKLFNQYFGIEDKQIDAYDPYHTNDAKPENFWPSQNESDEPKKNLDGKAIQKEYDDDTYVFKRGLYSQFGFRNDDFLYEEPFLPSFELFFNEDSSLFSTGNKKNSLEYFLTQYETIDASGYKSRIELWKEFLRVFFKIFEKDTSRNVNRSQHNKAYYITKVGGLNNLNKKFINYGEDKITITLNEDVSMIAWYISELYNNIIYSYRHQRYAVPENVIRFDMTIQINDMRNFVIPQNSSNPSSTVPVDPNSLTNTSIKNILSEKSKIIYTLHDCNFNFFESRNYGDEIEIGGYGTSVNNTPQQLSFDINFKSVTRWSEFPLIKASNPINPWEDIINSSIYGDSKQNYYSDLNRIKVESTSTTKSFMNENLTTMKQNISNVTIGYLDNLETKLREVRGGVVNDLLKQFRNSTGINKIQPDNVYNPDFNNRTSLKNFGKQIGASILNDLESSIREGANF